MQEQRTRSTNSNKKKSKSPRQEQEQKQEQAQAQTRARAWGAGRAMAKMGNQKELQTSEKTACIECLVARLHNWRLPRQLCVATCGRMVWIPFPRRAAD